MYDVFISSKSEDYIIAENVYNFLVSKGKRVFLAPRELHKERKDVYYNVIDKALEESSHMVVVASSVSNIDSNYVKYEWGTFSELLLSEPVCGRNLLTILKDTDVKDLPLRLRFRESFVYDDYQNSIMDFLPLLNQSDLVLCALKELLLPGTLRQIIASSMEEVEKLILNELWKKHAYTRLRDNVSRYLKFQINSADICPNTWKQTCEICDKEHRTSIGEWALMFEKSVRRGLDSCLRNINNGQLLKKGVNELPSCSMDFCENMYRIYKEVYYVILNCHHSYYSKFLSDAKRNVLASGKTREIQYQQFKREYQDQINKDVQREIQPIEKKIALRRDFEIKLLRDLLEESCANLVE